RRPIVLTKSPRGKVIRGSRYPRSPYAGAFSSLQAVGSSSPAGIHFGSRYDFAPDRIAIAWKATRTRVDPLSLEAMLPSWGEAAISAILKSGVKARLTGQTPDLKKVNMAG